MDWNGDTKKDLAKQDAVAIGVSPDPVARLKKFEEKEGLNFTLLSDEDHAIADKYGVWGLKKFMGREFMGIIRSTFVLNPEGAVAHVWSNVRVKGHVDKVLGTVQELASS